MIYYIILHSIILHSTRLCNYVTHFSILWQRRVEERKVQYFGDVSFSVSLDPFSSVSPLSSSLLLAFNLFSSNSLSVMQVIGLRIIARNYDFQSASPFTADDIVSLTPLV